MPVRSILVSVLAMLAVIAFSEGLKRNYYGLDAPVAAVSNYDPRVDASPAVYTAGLGCDTGHFSSQLVGCHIGSRNGTSLAVLFGDSIGAQWSSLVTGLFPAPDWQVLVLTKSACAIVDEPYYYDKAGGEYTVCSEWRNAALKYLENIKPDIVFVGSASGYDFSELQWTNGSRRVLSRLASAAEQVVVIPGNPSLSFDGPSCLDEPYKFSYRLADSERECEEAQLSSTSDQVAGFLRNAVRDFPNAEVLDLNDLVCPGRRCAARTEDGLTVFRDNQHLTMTFVDAQIPEASRRLQASDIRIAAD